MNAELLDHLTDTVYRAALEPHAWDDVMQLMQAAFRSSAQSFYFLDLAPRRIRPMALSGVDRRWLSSFDAAYFAPDNPWFRFTRDLHRPGVVRTNEMLASFARDHDALFRSAYFNEWMRPQRMRHTLGSTMLAERGVIANVTLLRPPDMPTFAVDEVSAFTRISAHMTRALRIAIQLEDIQTADPSTPLAVLGQGVALIDADGRLVGTNARMEGFLAAGHGLVRQDGRLVATRDALSHQLHAAMAAVLRDVPAPLVAFAGRRGSGVRLALRVQRASASAGGHYLPAAPRVLVTVTESGRRPVVSAELLQHLYGLTRAEAALAALVVEGRSLPEAARIRGIGHGTARGYLKIIFGKTGVHSQSALAARVLTDLAGTH